MLTPFRLGLRILEAAEGVAELAKGVRIIGRARFRRNFLCAKGRVRVPSPFPAPTALAAQPRVPSRVPSRAPSRAPCPFPAPTPLAAQPRVPSRVPFPARLAAQPR